MTATATPAPSAIELYGQKLKAIRRELRDEYLQPHAKPWIIGFSGGKDSTLLAQLVVEGILSVAPDERQRQVYVCSNDTLVESPVFQSHVNAVLARMAEGLAALGLPVEVVKTTPLPDESFWVNLLGRGYPPPNRIFRWCTQRLKIDPVTSFVQKRLSNGHWSEAILHLGARRAESATRAQTMAGREKRNGLNRHPDLPRVWVSNPIEFLTTEEVWAWLLQKPNPWGGDNRPLYKLYASAANGECPIQIDTSTRSCGRFSLSASTGERAGVRCRNPRTCTVVERDRASEGLTEKVDEFSESHRAVGLPDDLLAILKN